MRLLGILGKFLISVGVGVLLFVAWTLYGTGFYTQQEQKRLSQEFRREPAAPGEQRGGFVSAPGGFHPGPGDPVFRLRIPAIELAQMVVEGVNVEDLKLGPGHYPECRSGFPKPLCTELEAVWPGEKGRVIVSGHRTTYGAPFWDLDKLRRGDEIITQTKWGTFTYKVSETEVVAPNSTDIANPAATTTGGEIALTTCNPRFSAAQRLIVYAEMEVSA